MTEWIYSQLIQTWQLIQTEITIPHIMVGVIAYGIVHKIIAVLKKTQLEIAKQRRAIVRSHVRNGHTNKLKHCQQDDCQLLATTEALTA